MRVAVCDVETTTFQKGNPFAKRNFLVLGGFYDGKDYTYFTANDQQLVSEYLRSCKRLILFNGKFDLHWLRRMGVEIPETLGFWDGQLAEFILSNQRWKFPDLEESAALRGLPAGKLDIVKTEYWDKGIDTDQIPYPILQEYLQQDLLVEWQLALAQMKAFQSDEHKGKFNLFKVGCMDLGVLEEMEWNGIKYNAEASRAAAAELSKDIARIDGNILRNFPNVPINLGSNDHKSCLLYGGRIIEDLRVPVGVYKTGAKTGETRFKIVEQEYQLPRLIEPLKGSALAKEGYFSTDEGTLRMLKPTGVAKQIIDGLLERAKLEKLRGTYLDGLPNLIEKMDWPDGYLHGQLNQCVVVTGRLSASKPNQQNLDPRAKVHCVSRYDCTV